MAWNMAIGSAHDIKLRNEEEQLVLGMMSPEFVSGTRKRHHQTLMNRHDDLEDDDLCGDLGCSSEKKRRLTIEQVKYLEMSFNMDLKLEPERKALIAKQLGLRPRQVAIWFQNRRARWKNKQLEQDYEALKVKFEAILKQKESMLTKHEEIMEENKNLQEEVTRLRALLQNGDTNLTPDATTIPILTIEKPSLDGESDSESKDQSGKSELTSPTKSSSDDQSEMQDSGHSYHVSQTIAIASVDESPIAELDSYNIVVKMEPNDQHIDQHHLMPPDEMFGNYIHPLQYPHLYYADDLFPNWEDHQMHGITWVG